MLDLITKLFTNVTVSTFCKFQLILERTNREINGRRYWIMLNINLKKNASIVSWRTLKSPSADNALQIFSHPWTVSKQISVVATSRTVSWHILFETLRDYMINSCFQHIFPLLLNFEGIILTFRRDYSIGRGYPQWSIWTWLEYWIQIFDKLLYKNTHFFRSWYSSAR